MTDADLVAENTTVRKISMREALPFLSPVILEICNQYRRAPHEVQAQLRASLALTIRNCERYVTPRVSVAAHNKAVELRISDLRLMAWRNQKTIMKDSDRSIFHFEHIVPVNDIVTAILALPKFTLGDIEQLVAKSAIAWILKTENVKLPRTKRSDPYAVYASKQIELMPE